VFVTYKIEDDKSSGKVLKVSEQRVLNKDFMEEAPKDEDFLPLIEGLSEITFEYYREAEDEEGTGEWVASWDGKDETELPRQIRVNLKWKEKKEESEISLPALLSIPAHFYDDKGKPTTSAVLGQKPKALFPTNQSPKR
jgi:hypothetical protein